ncbi:hypothetical protein CHS0354_027867 [Potamilus streckersoni]|uniref:Uncharacterized protein n=1 Tax=Potamilus streckersoni TaxID=2493646 RepID=A0AAE0RL81_9BIVA|nr:hypothetical protein CHS0354_027867 [Potamilus streckersoni]
MKLALVFLAVLPFILASTEEEKRFLEFLHLESLNLNKLVDQLKTLVHSGMGHSACVAACTAIASLLSPLCGKACTMALDAIPTAKSDVIIRY